MAAASCLLTEDQFLCSICLDVFNDPVTIPCGHNFCKNCITQHWNSNILCLCPNCNKVFLTEPELHINTFISEMSSQFRQSVSHPVQLVTSTSSVKQELEKAKLQQMIQERELKVDEIIRSLKLSKMNAAREITEGVKVFTVLKDSVERGQADFIKTIREKQETAEKQAEDFITQLNQEISDLTNKKTEGGKLSQFGDHLLKNISFLNSLPPTKDWTQVRICLSEGTVVRAVTKLEKTLSEQMKKLFKAEVKRVQEYSMYVSLDANTAHPSLILSNNLKQVKHGCVKNILPDNPERFDTCACVLAKQSFYFVRFYFKVQVKGKTEWDVGVVRESINRKGQIKASPRTGIWIISLRKANEYSALADPTVVLSVKSQPEKVGVFVDYEQGLVSFYDADTAALIYSFTDCCFSEKLYPFLSPCHNNGGANSAPMIILH